jgi:DNA topoisomerase-1
VICEKADAAKRISNALGDRIKTYNVNGVPLHIVESKSERFIVCSALGHLYGIGTSREKKNIYPVFDLMWFPLNKIKKDKKNIEPRIHVISELSKKAKKFVNACDYDIEGSTIGYNIIRYACNADPQKVLRAKFSTLTKEDLFDSFNNLKLGSDEGLARAGITRHIVDYIWGINLSRILSDALQQVANNWRIISTGRVQGPTLKFVVDREIGIRSFVTTPYWKLRALMTSKKETFYADYFEDRVTNEKHAMSVKEENEGKTGIVEELRETRFQMPPPTPFNTGDLQKEAYRLFGFNPSLTLNIAERLYLRALVSYPRTNSQKLPPSIDYKKILIGLGRLNQYKEEANILLKTELIPYEGAGEDSAHPSIYPTGEIPTEKMDMREEQVYDLIVRRFFSIFGDNLIRENVQLSIFVADKHYWKVNGKRTIHLGWLVFYEKYIEMEEKELPSISKGENAYVKLVEVCERYGKHPPRFNRGSLLEKMEEENLGTKATRAETIEILYSRDYILGDIITPTDLGFLTIEILTQYCHKIVSVNLTKELEEQLERIEREQDSSERALEDTFYLTLQSIDELSNNLEEVGFAFKRALQQTIFERNTLGKCPLCKEGKLIIIRSKKSGKRFVGCTNYRKGCRASAPLPQRGIIQKSTKICEKCHWPVIFVKGGRIPWRLCVNPQCPLKKARKVGFR